MGELGDDAFGALAQLHAPSPQVHHQVALDTPKFDHRGGADHVQDEFLGCSCFHASGASDNFRTDDGSNDDIGDGSNGGISVDGDGDRLGAPSARFVHGGDDERGSPTDGKTDDDIVDANIQSAHLFTPRFHIVFSPFNGTENGLRTASNDADDPFRRCAKSGGGIRRRP
jgi:hypothetical protein